MFQKLYSYSYETFTVFPRALRKHTCHVNDVSPLNWIIAKLSFSIHSASSLFQVMSYPTKLAINMFLIPMDISINGVTSSCSQSPGTHTSYFGCWYKTNPLPDDPFISPTHCEVQQQNTILWPCSVVCCYHYLQYINLGELFAPWFHIFPRAHLFFMLCLLCLFVIDCT